MNCIESSETLVLERNCLDIKVGTERMTTDTQDSVRDMERPGTKERPISLLLSPGREVTS